MNKDSLGDRMKTYENAFRHHLPNRLPVIVRIDGRAFHSFTKGFNKPFDDVLMKTMYDTAAELCKNVAGCKLAYVQSDEISLLLTNDDSIDTAPWFDNNIMKLVSITASIATRAFNRRFITRAFRESPIERNLKIYVPKFHEAEFNSRVFILPEHEVVNYFIWRQQDATRNSIQMVAQSMYSHKELQGKNSNDLQEMIFQKGKNFDDYTTAQKRGVCIIKKPKNFVTPNGEEVVRQKWTVDKYIPIFTQDRNYIESRFMHKE